MYVITADDTVVTSGSSTVTYEGTVIHATGSDDHQFLALVAGLSLEISKSGTLSLTIPPTNYALRAGKLKKLTTIIRIYKNFVHSDNLIWKGRILDSSKDFLGRVTYRCEGWLSVLCDSVVRPDKTLESDEKIVAAPDEMFEALITAHNSQVEGSKQLTAHTYGFHGEPLPNNEVQASSTHDTVQFGSTGSEVRTLQQYLNKLNYTLSVDGIFGQDTDRVVKAYQTNKGMTADGVVDSNVWDALEADVSGASHYTVSEAEFPNGTYENTLDYIQTNLLQNIEIGGTIWVNESDIYYYAEGYEDYAKQDIVFGENLLDFTEFVDASEIYTVLIPVGKDDLTLESTYGVDYIEADEDTLNLFGRIVRKEDFSDIEDASALAEIAERTLSENIKENTTIDISAFDLSLLNVDEDSFKVGEYVRITSSPHSIDSYYLCTAITIDLCSPAKSTYTLGVNPDTLTGRISHNRLPSGGYGKSSGGGGGGGGQTGEFWGIDVSSWNDLPNWSALTGVIQNVVLRINNGKYGEDTSFEHNYEGATAAGLDVGVYKYIYGDTVAEVRAEAESVVNILNGRTLRQPVWFDMEEVKYESMSTDTIAAMIEAFREVIEDAGYYFGIYTNRNWWKYLLPEYTKTAYEFWIAAFPEPAYDTGAPIESLRPSYGVGWQYSGKGYFPKFHPNDNNLDLNVFYKTWEARP